MAINVNRLGIPLNPTNGSSKYYTGSVWDSKLCGSFEIVGQLPAERVNGKNYTYYRVQFPSGYVTHKQACAIYRGQVRDPYYPTVCGVGYHGEGLFVASVGGKYTKQYWLWRNVIERCYSERKQSECPTYVGCTMDDSWLCFQTFCHLITYIPNYVEWLDEGSDITELDKDILGYNMHYSVATCVFTTRQLNTGEMHTRTKNKRLTGHTYIAQRLSDGYVEAFVNCEAFKRKYNKDFRISSVLNSANVRKQSLGWTFSIKS